MISIFNFDDCFAECWYHVKLLYDTVHVANTAQIFETHISWERSLLLLYVNGPINFSGGSPESLIAYIYTQILGNIQFVLKIIQTEDSQ